MAFSVYRCDLSKTIKLYEHEKALFMAQYLQHDCQEALFMAQYSQCNCRNLLLIS